MSAEARHTLMGPGPGQFNLAATRARAQELKASLEEVVRALATNAHMLNWEVVLKKFTTINLQVMALKEQLRGVLRTVVVHPRMVEDPRFAQALPIQLASAVMPEMEAEDAGLVAREAAALDAQGVPQAARYEVADAHIEDFNRLVSELTTSGGPLDAQGGDRQELTARSKAIRKATENARQALAAQAQRPGAGPGGQGGQGPAAKRSRPNEGPQALDPALLLLLSGPAALKQQQPGGMSHH